MRTILSLALSTLICMFLINRIPMFGLSLVFVYLPVIAVVVRKIVDRKFSRHLLLNELTGLYSFKPDTPRVFRWYSNALDIFLGMVVGFAIAYFFKGGWVK